jgi:hypothetical protein
VLSLAGKRGSAKGARKPAQSVLNSTAKSKISPNKPDIVEKEPYHKCCACGHKYEAQRGNFSVSQSPFFHGNNKFLPICTKCVDKFVDQYTDLFESQDEAIKRICLHWDIYMSDSLIESSKKVSADNSRIKGLIKQCNMSQNAGKTYDTYLHEQEEESRSDIIETAEDFDRLKGEDKIKLSKNSLKVWGFGFSADDLEFLNSEFADWKARTIVEGKNRESLVKELCIIKLQQNKSLLAGNIDTYQKLTDTFQKTLDRANLTPKIEDANEKAGEKPIGVMIEMFENEHPIPEPLECWKDIDGIMKLITVYFIGHLCKMLGIKNRYAKMYEDEMDKYRVEIPELEEADSEDVYDYLLNNGFESNEETILAGGEANDNQNS